MRKRRITSRPNPKSPHINPPLTADERARMAKHGITEQDIARNPILRYAGVIGDDPDFWGPIEDAYRESRGRELFPDGPIGNRSKKRGRKMVSSSPTAADLMRQLRRLSDEIEQVKFQLWKLSRPQTAPMVTNGDADFDEELRALVGIDPPLSLAEERKELRRVLVRRHHK